MTEYLMLSIGIGLVISLLFSELFGLAAGGMVVPGYFALFITRPLDVLMTIGIALLTYWIVTLISNVVILYGRRRTVLMILIGYLLGIIARQIIPSLPVVDISSPPDVIGYIIPGLIAIWIERQGLIETFSTLICASVVIRLILILILGDSIRI